MSRDVRPVVKVVLFALFLCLLPKSTFAQDETWVDSFTVDNVPVSAALTHPSMYDGGRRASVYWAAALWKRLWTRTGLTGLPVRSALRAESLRSGATFRKSGFVRRSHSSTILRAGASLTDVDLRCSGGARSWNPDVDITVWIGITLNGTLVASNQATGYMPSTVASTIVSTVDYDRPIECGVYASGAQAIAQGTFYADCGNDSPTTMRQEYKVHSVNWMPPCNEFAEYPDQWMVKPEDTHGSWGIIKGVLYTKLAAIQEYALLGNMQITSGYRCPHKNAAIPSSASQSRHMYGDALDMYPPQGYYSPPNEYYFNWIRDAALQTSPGFITEWSTYPSDRHLHVDWR